MTQPLVRLLTVLAILLGGVAEAIAHPAVAVAIDRRGNIFYSDLEQVWQIDPSGRKSVVVPRLHTHELFLDADDTLYGEHVWYEGAATKEWGHRVWKRTAAGLITDVIPATRGFRRGYSFVRDRAGNMYWADRRPTDAHDVILRRTSPTGATVTMAGGPTTLQDGRGTSAGFANIRWIAAMPDGVLYVIDNGCLRKVSPDGTVTTIARDLDEITFGFLEDRQHAVMGLCPDEDGNVWVANSGARKIKIVNPAGRVSVFAASPFPFAPSGVTVTRDAVYVLEDAVGKSVRVRKYSRDGKLLATY